MVVSEFADMTVAKWFEELRAVISGNGVPSLFDFEDVTKSFISAAVISLNYADRRPSSVCALVLNLLESQKCRRNKVTVSTKTNCFVYS